MIVTMHKVVSLGSRGERDLIQSNRYEPSDPQLTQVPDFVGKLVTHFASDISICSGTLVQASNDQGEIFKAFMTAASCLRDEEGTMFTNAQITLGQNDKVYQYSTSVAKMSPDYKGTDLNDVAILAFEGPKAWPAALLNTVPSAPAFGTPLAVSGFGYSSQVGSGSCGDLDMVGRTEYTQYSYLPGVSPNPSILALSWNKQLPLAAPDHYAAICPGDAGAFIGKDPTVYALANFQGPNSLGTTLYFGGPRVAQESWLSPSIASGKYTNFTDTTTSSHHHLDKHRIVAIYICVIVILGAACAFTALPYYILFAKYAIESGLKRANRLRRQAMDVFRRQAAAQAPSSQPLPSPYSQPSTRQGRLLISSVDLDMLGSGMNDYSRSQVESRL